MDYVFFFLFAALSKISDFSSILRAKNVNFRVPVHLKYEVDPAWHINDLLEVEASHGHIAQINNDKSDAVDVD